MNAQRLLDRLAYVEAYAPEFPAEDRTTLDAELLRVFDELAQLRGRAGYEAVTGLLDLARVEIEQARAHYYEWNAEAGQGLLRDARDHIREALGPQRRGPSFVGGPGGLVRNE